MVRITEELLRRRAEHNEGILTTLKEITLHQQEIEKIEHLGTLCRHLEILYLQGNYIGKIENLKRLKELKYLNLALNNITKIEGLENCEELEKLDLTVNLVDDLISIESLKGLYNLKELHLLGNPCASYDGYRDFVIATLTQLKSLDLTPIEEEERKAALERLPELRNSILKQQEEQHPKTLKSREQRIQEYNELQERKEQEAKKREEQEQALKKKRKQAVEDGEEGAAEKVFKEDGTVLQKNEGGYKFKLEDLPDEVVLHLYLSKFLDTSLVSISPHPTWIEATIKKKLFRVNLPAEVHPDKSKAERSMATGELMIRLPKVHPERSDSEAKEEKKEEPVQVAASKRDKTGAVPSSEAKLQEGAKAVDIRNIVKQEGAANMQQLPADDDVPPLEDI